MSRPIDSVLSRLDSAKPSGPERWRSACPACGGNKSALSIGVANNDAVLLRCWKGCTVDEVAGAIGLELQDLFPPREAQSGPLVKRNLITARQALDLLHDEALVLGVVGSDIAHGLPVSATDGQRCLQAAARIAYLRSEVMS